MGTYSHFPNFSGTFSRINFLEPTIAMDIKEIRGKLNLTQQELADKTGIPRERIAKWEQGKGSPKLEDYLKLEGLMKMHLEEVHNKAEHLFRPGLAADSFGAETSMVNEQESKLFFDGAGRPFAVTSSPIHEYLMRKLDERDRSLDKLVESNNKLAEANLTSARNMEALIEKLSSEKSGKAPSPGEQDPPGQGHKTDLGTQGELIVPGKFGVRKKRAGKLQQKDK